MKRGDVITALALLALAGMLLVVRMAGAGNQGAVYVNGEAAQASLTVNGVAVEIEGNRARVTDSPCGDKLCVRAGWLERPGDVAVCLPRRVIVEVRGGRSGVDGHAG
jgi:hypothetical protein